MDTSVPSSAPSGRAPAIELHLTGSLRAALAGRENVLPPLRKAQALFVVLALSEECAASRRYLASLLWSRFTTGQALARLRDALSALRKSLAEVAGGDAVLVVAGDRVSLRPGSVNVSRAEVTQASEIAADLNGVDPALDDWLRAVRSRLVAHSTPAKPEVRGRSGAARRGSVIGIGTLTAIGPQADGFFCVALADEIATALSRIRGLVVISTTSTAAAQDTSRDLRRDLGIDFVLEGAVQQVGHRRRISVKLVDAETGAMCWTANFDVTGEDSLLVQQEVATLVAAGLEPELPIIAGERLRRLGDTGEDVYPLILRAIARIHLLDRQSFMEAGELLTRAMNLEPEYSPAHSWFALWLAFLVGQGWARDPRSTIARAGEAAEHAVMLDPNDARGLTVAGHVRAYLHRRIEEALPLHERALALNPSLPLAWHFSGVAHAYKGDLAEARRRLQRCRQLAPRDPHSFYAEGAGIIVELLSRNHQEAAAIGRRVTQLHPRFSAAYKPYLAALGHLGDTKEAVAVHRRLIALEPEFSVRAFRATSPYATREHHEHYLAGLSLAGVC